MKNNYIFPFLWMRGESEEIIREEIQKISECGIRAVCVEARPHDDFCGPGWWHDMDIVIDEARKRDMKIWILDDKHFPTGYAAGLIETKYPERKKWYLADTTADLFGGEHMRTVNVQRMLKPVIGYWQIGQPANEEERKNNRLVALAATRFSGKNLFAEDVIDLTDTIKDGKAEFQLPGGQWRLHAIYRTRTDGGNEDYINMLDKVSAHTQIEGVYESHYQHYGEEFGKTIAGFFSDEPELGNTKEITFEAKVGRPGMPLPWSDELAEMLQERFGDRYCVSLALLFAETENGKRCAQVRYDYMDCVSRLYERNFSRPVGDWCAAHGVEYIGHVVEDDGTHSRTGHGPGHWFRAMAGQDMAGIDIIGNQVIFGAPTETRKGMGGMEIDGEFFHYILGKLGASGGHLDPRKKGRTMCELFGAYGWNFGVRDMRYLLDHLLCRGVNHLVPHAFSMAEYPDIDCPPHFYARGNNGQFSWFAELMKYANRMCDQLNGGTHVSSVAVLYDGEADWTGGHMPMQKVGKVLTENQIEFDVVSLDMLKDPGSCGGRLEGRTLIINGVSFDALIVPYMRYMPSDLAEFTKNSGDFPVLYVDGYPEAVLQGETGSAGDETWKEKGETVKLSDLARLLGDRGMRRIMLEPAAPSVTVYHYQKAGQMFLLMNESAGDAYCGKVFFPAKEKLFCYDGDRDLYLPVKSAEGCGGRTVEIALEPGQSLMIVEESAMNPEIPLSFDVWESFRGQLEGCARLADVSGGWKAELSAAKEYPQSRRTLEMDSLVPVSDLEPDFSGIIRYTGEFELEEIPRKVYFKAEHVYEVMRVWVNGEPAGSRLVPPYQLEIQKYLQPGRNTVVAEVANTPGRDQSNYPSAPFDFQHEPLEPSGMFGEVTLYGKNEI